jgi:hypothetical protein
MLVMGACLPLAAAPAGQQCRVVVPQVADLQWLPGLEFGAHGRLQPEGSRPSSSSTPAAGGVEKGKGCWVLATTAADGRVLFWDSRLERLLRKGRKAEDAATVVWRPSHSMHLLSGQGMDLQVRRSCGHWLHAGKPSPPGSEHM